MPFDKDKINYRGTRGQELTITEIFFNVNRRENHYMSEEREHGILNENLKNNDLDRNRPGINQRNLRENVQGIQFKHVGYSPLHFTMINTVYCSQ